MAGFRQFFTFFLMESINIGPVYIRGWAGGARGWGRWWQKLYQRRNKTQRVEFRVATTCTCTHKGPIFHYKAWTDVHWQWEPYQVPTANLGPSFGAISPVVDLHGRQKAFRESRPVHISQWRQCTCIVI